MKEISRHPKPNHVIAILHPDDYVLLKGLQEAHPDTWIDIIIDSIKEIQRNEKSNRN